METTSARTRFAIYLTIAAVAVVTYLPAINNFFISDDFGMLAYVNSLQQAPLSIVDAPSEFFRLTSYVYFSACLRIFGTNSVAFYCTGIALHVAVSLLVYILVLKTTGETLAAWAAAVFFAAYERHQEAVMWISASNSTLVTLFCLVFLILWKRSTYWSHKLALVVLAAALFSKETAVTLAPLAIMTSTLNRRPWRTALRETAPVFAITAGYIYIWLSYSGSNAFVTNHYYALSLHFLPIYARGIFRLVSVALPFVLAVHIAKRQSLRGIFLEHRRPLLLFGAIIALALLPVSFLTYQTSLPSRNTYYPSVGLSALVGMLFFAWHRDLSSRKAGHLAIFFFSTVIVGNISYVWLKKDPQYIARAAPTRQLIVLLNDVAPRPGMEQSICVESFPLDPWTGTEAARWFTHVSPPNITFSTACEITRYDIVLHWNERQGLSYIGRDNKVIPVGINHGL